MRVFVCQGDCTYACLQENNFKSFLPRSMLLLCYVWNERRPSLAVPSVDSRKSPSLCGSRGGTKTFPPEELWVPVDKEGSALSRVVFICLCTVGLYGAAEAYTFQTTSGGCINSHPWRNIKGRRKFHPMIKIPSGNEVCVCVCAHMLELRFALKHELKHIKH